MHIAAIMDGNRRWAQKNKWKKFLGHQKGVQVLEDIVLACPQYDIKVFTVYALSTENLQRASQELNDLFKIIIDFCQKKENFKKNNIKVKILGNIKLLPSKVQESLFQLETYTNNSSGLLFQICLAYGGRNEIIRSMKKTMKNKEEINEKNIQKNLDSESEPDLIIRTGGHQRLSNFLIWQGAYSEFLFLDKMWPDFTKKDLEEAICYFKKQKRNFGK